MRSLGLKQEVTYGCLDAPPRSQILNGVVAWHEVAERAAGGEVITDVDVGTVAVWAGPSVRSIN